MLVMPETSTCRPPPEQLVHSHLSVQRWGAPLGHLVSSPGLHAPSPVHWPQPDQVPLLHVRFWLPQLPQACVSEPWQICPRQSPHLQLVLQLWLPPPPQLCVLPGSHSPCWPQLDQPDQTPLLQTRVCVPQLPQLWMSGPLQV